MIHNICLLHTFSDGVCTGCDPPSAVGELTFVQTESVHTAVRESSSWSVSDPDNGTGFYGVCNCCRSGPELCVPFRISFEFAFYAPYGLCAGADYDMADCLRTPQPFPLGSELPVETSTDLQQIVPFGFIPSATLRSCYTDPCGADYPVYPYLVAAQPDTYFDYGFCPEHTHHDRYWPYPVSQYYQPVPVYSTVPRCCPHSNWYLPRNQWW
jgi:hypothetical protein